jgi:dipeptidyl aminopeptidase/acylaminoacyl peptidase
MNGDPLTPAHALRLRFVRDAGFIGDGAHGFYLASETDEQRETHSLWLFGYGEPRRLGEELGDLRAPALSPDGSTLAVLAAAGEPQQIWLLPVDGSEARVLTSLPQGVSGRPSWSPDGRSIAFTAGPQPRDRSRPYRITRPIYRYELLGYVEDVLQDVYVADVERGDARQLTDDDVMNSDPRWSPDGTRLSYMVSLIPGTVLSQAQLHVLSVETGESHVVVSGWGGVLRAAWCGDGRLAFVGWPASGYAMTDNWNLWVVDAAGGEPQCRTASVPAGIGSGMQYDWIVWETGGTRILVRGDDAYVAAQVGGDVVVDRVALTGPESVEQVHGAEGASAYLLDVGPGGEILTIATSALDPPELAIGSTPVTRLNADVVEGVVRPDLHHLEVTAPDGFRSEAWALTPPGEHGPWPAVLYVHGGPYGAFGSTYMIDFHLLVGAGFAVVFHNFRGSRGYGRDHGHAIVGDWGRQGQLDHHAALDAAIAAGIADADRLGVCGYSHGGFATCWLVGTSERFKAAVAENPVVSWTSAWGIADDDSWIAKELGGRPWEVPDVYRERSPLTYAPNCTTPVLFVVGESDLRCPAGESEQYYRVLHSNGVPAEMLRLPNSAHLGTWDGPVPSRTAQNEALVEWFQRWV